MLHIEVRPTDTHSASAPWMDCAAIVATLASQFCPVPVFATGSASTCCCVTRPVETRAARRRPSGASGSERPRS